jgi:hypothetical protein
MPKFLEDKLKAEYGAKSAVPFKVMNAIGAMRGNKETPKGAMMATEHAAKMKLTKDAVKRIKTKAMPGWKGGDKWQ